jgi:hypothetical protein
MSLCLYSARWKTHCLYHICQAISISMHVHVCHIMDRAMAVQYPRRITCYSIDVIHIYIYIGYGLCAPIVAVVHRSRAGLVRFWRTQVAVDAYIDRSAMSDLSVFSLDNVDIDFLVSYWYLPRNSSFISQSMAHASYTCLLINIRIVRSARIHVAYFTRCISTDNVCIVASTDQQWTKNVRIVKTMAMPFDKNMCRRCKYCRLEDVCQTNTCRIEYRWISTNSWTVWTSS